MLKTRTLVIKVGMMDRFQKELPFNPFVFKRLPGIGPLDPKQWLLQDDAFEFQMSERARLLGAQRSDVLRSCDGSEPAQQELLDAVLNTLLDTASYRVGATEVRRPDGVTIAIDRADPLGTLGHLVQEDFCILEPRGDQSVLTAAVLCFPASWRLSDKIDQPLTHIHIPVGAYTADLAKRVQRMFDAIHPDKPLWRNNCLWYEQPELFQPNSRVEPVSGQGAITAAYLRSERQCLLRLPKTGAVVFSIHTYMLTAKRALELKRLSDQSAPP